MGATRAIIFDCFGVVVSDGFTDIIADLKLSDQQISEISKLMELVNKATISIQDYSEKAARVAGISTGEYLKRTNNNLKNKQLLNYIKELRNNYKTAMLSNVGSRASLESRFEDNELENYFDVVIASAEIGYAKPEAQAYAITAEKLGVRLEDCVMIDDREEYCLGAQGVGMKDILYVDFGSLKKQLESILS